MIDNSIEKLIEIRAALFAAIRSDKHLKNRRATLIAYKHVDKALRALGGPRLEVPGRKASNATPVYSPQETPEPIALTQGVVLADNSAPATGPEKPTKAKRR